MKVDFGKTSRDYAEHRAGFPAELFEALAERDLSWRGARVLDAGCGTGALALRFAAEGARVTALDVSAEQLEVASARAREQGLPLEVVHAPLEGCGLPAASFDLISGGQCWHWFDAMKASRELRRLLAAGGRVLLASYDWLPLPGSVVEATEALILEHNPGWRLAGGDGRHPEWRRDLEASGFEVLETEYGDVPAVYTHEGWRGRIRASAGVAASLEPEAVRVFDGALERLLLERFPDDPLAVPHRWGFCLARLPESA